MIRNGSPSAGVSAAGFLVVPRRVDHRELVAVTAELRAEARRVRRELEWLWIENEVLREVAAPLNHQAAARERFAFIHGLRNRFVVPDLIRRDFTAPMPGLKLTGDISCFPTGEGRVYLATVLDLCGKELIGYAIAPHMRASLAVEAISTAYRAGLVDGNAIMNRSNATSTAAPVRPRAWRCRRPVDKSPTGQPKASVRRWVTPIGNITTHIITVRRRGQSPRTAAI
jgi:transposase InsO family protein